MKINLGFVHRARSRAGLRTARSRSARIIANLVVGAVALVVAASAHAQGDLRAAGARLEAARKADLAGDSAGYYEHARAANELAPPHPVLLYHFARASARTGRTEEALSILARLTPLGTPRDPAADSGFRSLWPMPAFAERVAAMKQAVSPLIASDTAFVIDTTNLVVENIAYDASTKMFYVGSMARRMIFRVDRSGHASVLTDSSANLGQPLGMKVDVRGRLLWVAGLYPADSAAGFPRTRGALMAISLPSGRVVRRLTPSDTVRPHLLNDLVIANNGTIYVSDSEGKAVWVLAPKSDSLRELVRFPDNVLYPNGIALAADGRTLLVAHQTGLLAVDAGTGSFAPVATPEGPTFLGIDGLYVVGGSVLGIVNNGAVAQVVHGALNSRNKGAVSITCGGSLERGHPAYEIPTTGTLVGDTLFYAANSQLRRLTPKGLQNPEEKARTVVLRLPIPPQVTRASCATRVSTPSSHRH